MIFTRHTDRSRKSVEAAFEEARLLGHDSLGDEDLLLGILRAGEGMGAAALSSLGVLLVHGLLADAQHLGDPRPRPSRDEGVLNLRRLQSLQRPPQGNDSLKPLPRVLRPTNPGPRLLVHASIIVDDAVLVNLY